MRVKYIIIGLTFILLLTSCQLNYRNNNIEEVSYVSELFQNKNEYVGDVSANGKILELLKIRETLGDYTIELKTDEVPYSIKLNFIEPVSNKEYFEKEFRGKAYLILALIDNVDEVQCIYSDTENTDGKVTEITVTRQQATDALGRDIKSYAQSETDIEELLGQLNSL